LAVEQQDEQSLGDVTHWMVGSIIHQKTIGWIGARPSAVFWQQGQESAAQIEEYVVMPHSCTANPG
jgi:hypothetical protein